MKRLISILFLLAFALPSLSQTAEQEFIESRLAGMTVPEKIGQLNQLDGRMDMAKLEAEIRAGRVSSLMNIVDPALVDRLQKIAVEESRCGIPIIFSRDVIHGFKTMMPIPLGQAAGWNEEIIEEGARVAAEEATEAGIRWGFTPMIDVSRDSRWGRIAESFGEDALLSSVFGLATVRGFQGTDLSSPLSIAACAKHFVGYGAARGGRDYNGTDLTERELRDTYLVPFRYVMQNGCASVMTSFQDNDGLQVSANRRLLRDIVRGEWGWDGLVVSDYGSIGQLTNHGIASSKKEAAKLGLNCGSDMDMQSKVYLTHLESLVSDGSVSMDDLDDAVRNVLRLKYRLGLFDHPYTQTITHDAGSPGHLGVALRSALESAVLLKNDGSLPLDPSRKLTLLVTGPMSDAAYDQLGTWNMDGDTTLTVTPRAAFRAREGKNLKVLYAPGLQYSRDKNTSGWKEVRRLARKADAILVCLGEEQILSGEAHSLADINLKGAQKEYVRFLAALGKPLIATVMAGRATTIGEEMEACNAVIYQFHPGTMGGEALARLVFGECNPSGKLPITFPKTEGQIPIYYNELRTGRSGVNKRAVSSLDDIPRSAKQSVLGHDCRYLDAGTKPLLPFGYGLSYTSFELGEPAVCSKVLGTSDTLRFSISLRNSGTRAGKEVIQVYVTDRYASVSRPVKELKAFRKVQLEPGESQKLEFSIPVPELGYHNAECKYEISPGTFEVLVADCSDPELASCSRRFEFTVRDYSQESCEICVYGGSASGCIAAVQAARMGRSVTLVSPLKHLGGMVTSGLTATDMNKHACIGGITAEFYGRIYEYYTDPAVWRNQTRDEFMQSTRKRTYTGKNDARRIQWVYESKVAETIMLDMLKQAGVKIIAGARLEESPLAVSKQDGRIGCIRLDNGTAVNSGMFIDASYEGDLMAAAGVSCIVGRESKEEYGEKFAGIRIQHEPDPSLSDLSPWKDGKLLPLVDAGPWGENGQADGRTQAYCYRLTLTDDPQNSVPIQKPASYNPDYYLMRLAQIRHNPDIQLKDIITFTPMPNRKTDTNHLDMFGGSFAYPEGSYAVRAAMEQQHRDYALGLLWFLGHDERVPERLRTEMLRWGLAADEFTDNGNMPHQIYVREARRMKGAFVMTEKNVVKEGREDAPCSIGLGSYPLDCHYVSTLVEDGVLKREGTMFQALSPYPIAYGAITPKKEECANLLVTVCMSASHVAYSSLRMEPQYMVLGQSAATAACMALEKGCSVQDVDYDALKDRLLQVGQILSLNTK